MTIPRLLTVVLTGAALLSASRAAETAPESPSVASETAAGKLDVGSPAPALNVSRWLQGAPVEALEKDKTYLIECWATWCGPCVAAIPHVNALHTRFKDKGLVVIGVNVWEQPAMKAEAFVKKKGEGMTYRVAHDSGDFAKSWLEAAGVQGIPHAFVVKENKILWQGHPASLTEATVSDMLSGKYDAAKVAAESAEHAKLEQEFGDLYGKFIDYARDGKVAEAESASKRLVELAEKLIPDQAPLLKLGNAVEISLAKRDLKSASANLRTFAEAGAKTPDNIGVPLRAAVIVLTDARLSGTRDYPFALSCIDGVITATPQLAGNPRILGMRARALEGAGKRDAAITDLEKAVSAAEAPEHLQVALTALKAGASWPKDELNPDGKEPAKPAGDAEKPESK